MPDRPTTTTAAGPCVAQAAAEQALHFLLRAAQKHKQYARHRLSRKQHAVHMPGARCSRNTHAVRTSPACGPHGSTAPSVSKKNTACAHTTAPETAAAAARRCTRSSPLLQHQQMSQPTPRPEHTIPHPLEAAGLLAWLLLGLLPLPLLLLPMLLLLLPCRLHAMAFATWLWFSRPSALQM